MPTYTECLHGLFAIFNGACVVHILSSLTDPPMTRGLLAQLFICAGLTYDNTILALGHFLSSAVLRNLSKPRFWLHCFVPVLAISVGEFIDRELNNSKQSGASAGLMLASLITPIQLYTMIRGNGLDLELKMTHDLVHYARKGFHALDLIPAVLVTLYAIVVMFGVSAAFPPSKHRFGGVFSNFGECCLMLGFLVTEHALRDQGK